MSMLVELWKAAAFFCLSLALGPWLCVAYIRLVIRKYEKYERRNRK